MGRKRTSWVVFLAGCITGAIVLSVGSRLVLDAMAGPRASLTKVDARTKATYRWATWSTYGQSTGWYAINSAALFGGVTPQQWGDANGEAASMSSASTDLRALFVRRGPAIETLRNAHVYSLEWISVGSTNSRHAAVLFRVKNTTGSPITWTVNWHATAFAGWNERASVTVNGASSWSSGGSAFGPSNVHSAAFSIPASRTSTVIFVAGSSHPGSGASRSTFLAFINDSLVLPAGLEFVDDLDTKPDGWGN